MIVVVDYGMGNLRSVAQALVKVAPTADVRISAQPRDIDEADRIVLPGQGALPDCMRFLRDAGLEAPVRRAAARKPLLAVCIGEQMLFERSEEGAGGATPGLGLLPGTVVRFRIDDAPAAGNGRLKVPHMGWNRVHQVRQHPLWRDVADDSFFYFVHSYYVEPAASELTVGRTDYGTSFTCAVARDNIFATQFHPEKSAAAGLKLYENFVRWNP